MKRKKRCRDVEARKKRKGSRGRTDRRDRRGGRHGGEEGMNEEKGYGMGWKTRQLSSF